MTANPSDKTLTLTLTDGSQRSFYRPMTVAEMAAAIGPGPAKSTVAGKVDDQLVDASDRSKEDPTVQIITPGDADFGLRVLNQQED